jgi:transmembrane secretion effector
MRAAAAPLRHRDFRLLWAGQTVSGLGNHVRLVAIPFQLLALGASPLELGLAAAILSATALVFLLIGGAVADRVPRRRLILASDLVGGCAETAIAILAWAGALRIEHIYVLTAVLGTAAAFLQPAFNAIVADLVPEDVRQSGNALRMLSRSLARTLGPIVGGVAVTIGGPALAFAIDAGTFFASFGVLLLARPPRREPLPMAPLLRQVREGFAFTFATPWLWIGSLYFALANLAFGGQAAVMTPLLVRDVLHGDAAMFGAINTAYGFGVVLGGAALLGVRVTRTGIAMYSFELLAGLCVLAIGLLPVLPAVAALMAVMGVSLTASEIVWTTALQRHVPPAVLARVSSIDLLAGSVLVPLAPIVASLVVEAAGPAAAFIVAGTFASVLAFIALTSSPVRRLT